MRCEVCVMRDVGCECEEGGMMCIAMLLCLKILHFQRTIVILRLFPQTFLEPNINRPIVH